MQEIKKTRIVIASVLKPVDDTRMFEKLGLTLASAYEVHIIGFPSGALAQDGINVHPVFRKAFSRLSLKRLLAPCKVAIMAIKYRPSLMMITTHELLLPAMFVKVFTGCKVIYDVQENYKNNILFTNAFPKGIRQLLAGYVRFKEITLAPFMDAFILAERTYADELPFVKNRLACIAENKFKGTVHSVQRNVQNHSRRLLFSGTLAQTTGVFTAIELATALHNADANITLTIIGYCARRKDYHRLKAAIANKPYIAIIGGDHLVPHERILQEIATHDVGIISYPPNPANDNKLPTKLFEYAAYRLPILLINNDVWVRWCEPYRAAIPFNPRQLDAESLLNAIKMHSFYNGPTPSVYWETEAPHVWHLISGVLNK